MYFAVKSSNTQQQTHARALAHTHTHTRARVRAGTHTHKHTHTHTHTCTHAHTHTPPHTNTQLDTHTGTSGQGHWRKSFRKEKGFQGRFEGTDRGCVTDRSGKLVPSCWSLVRERALTTWLCAKGWYYEHSGVCRRTELPKWSVKVKKVWEVGRGRAIQRFKEKWSEFEINPFFNLEPVQSMEKRCDMIEFRRPVDEPSSIVLNFLKPVKKVCQEGLSRTFSLYTMPFFCHNPNMWQERARSVTRSN